MSSNEYVPSEDKLRDAYADHSCPDFDAVHLMGCPAEKEFDRAIAAIKAEAKVEALREAVREIRPAEPTCDISDKSYGAVQVNALHYAADRLEAQVNQIERELD